MIGVTMIRIAPSQFLRTFYQRKLVRFSSTSDGKSFETTPPEQLTQNQANESHLETDSHDNDGRPIEIDGPKGPEPTRYGDWERKGRCYDF